MQSHREIRRARGNHAPAGKDGALEVRCIDVGCRAGRAALAVLATPRPFIAFVRRQAGAEFHVSFPDFPDCVSTGATLAEAKRNAQGALALHCWHLRDAGQPVPSPSFMHEIASRGAPADGLVILVLPPSLPG